MSLNISLISQGLEPAAFLFVEQAPTIVLERIQKRLGKVSVFDVRFLMLAIVLS
jgi:hypothetical protein